MGDDSAATQSGRVSKDFTGVASAVLVAQTRFHDPTDEHLSDRWLNKPITNEPSFTYRLGDVLSSTTRYLHQHTLSTHARRSLLEGLRAPGRFTGPALTSAQVAMLTEQPLWMTLPRRGCKYDPDIILTDAEDQVVWVIEAKGPRAARQCTPARALRDTVLWAPGRDATRFRDEVLGKDPSGDVSHAEDTCVDCWMTNRGAVKGEHVSAYHQCDAYRYGWDWVPDGVQVHPEVVWMALIRERRDAETFFEFADSTGDWCVADVEPFLVALGGEVPEPMTRWETTRLNGFLAGAKTLFNFP